MDDLFDQIKRANAAGLHYLAIIGALAIPDMCSALESQDGRTNGTKYAHWFDANLGALYADRMTGEDCYGLRCSVFHQGVFRPHKGGLERVIVNERRDAHRALMIGTHNRQTGGTYGTHLVLSAEKFCDEMVQAAAAWTLTAQSTPTYRANYERFMRRYAYGLPPFIVGRPVIA